MKRVREEELMEGPLQAQAYARADFSEPNAKFVALFSDKFPTFAGHHILDLGCGPADITMRLAARYPNTRLIGIDGADAMLALARMAILTHKDLAARIEIRRWHIGEETNHLSSARFDAVVCNSLLHHMRNPLDLWETIRACAAPGAAVLVMDLIRPHTRIEAETIVETYASKEPSVLRGDFLNSLLAAYRPAEITKQLVSIRMAFLQVEIVSDRHFIVFGIIR